MCFQWHAEEDGRDLSKVHGFRLKVYADKYAFFRYCSLSDVVAELKASVDRVQAKLPSIAKTFAAIATAQVPSSLNFSLIYPAIRRMKKLI